MDFSSQFGFHLLKRVKRGSLFFITGIFFSRFVMYSSFTSYCEVVAGLQIVKFVPVYCPKFLLI